MARPKLTTLALFVLAAIPRALAGRFLTVDEAYHWIGRVEAFVRALRAGDFAGTYLIGHPGVTTLWLGAAGTALHEQLAALGMISPADADTQRALLRLPVALATAACVALAYPLLRRLLESRAALLACLLMAAEPFVVAHAQLLHLDALLASFMTLSLLAALVGATADDGPRTAEPPPGRPPLAGRRWWLLSGALGGLALLTKSPAIFLLPMAGLVALAGVVWRARPEARPALRPALGAAIGRTALWGLAAAAVWLALWPAAWVDPLGVLGRVARQASADGGSPHGWGNFFLGRAVADPGPLFYPVTTVFRLAPWTALGVGCWVLSAVVRLRRGVRRPDRQGLALLLLALFAAGFVLALTLLPKKFDRYALPAFPALDVLAAAGLVRAAEALARRARVGGEPRGARGAARRIGRSWLAAGAWAAVLGGLALNLALIHPYELAYFSPLLGGGPAAARVVPVGWGEGYELAGAYIAAQPNGADRPAATRYEPVLAPFVPAGAAPLAWWQIPGRVDYAVLYIDQLQRDDKPETFTPLLRDATPVYTARINGIDYAYVYQIPPPVEVALPADFGDALHLRGYALDTSAVRADGALTLTLQWEARAAPGADYALFAHVFDAGGVRVAQVDVPPGGDRAPTGTWQPGHYYALVQQIPVPADLPAGSYRVAIGVYDPASFARLPLRAGQRPPLPEAGGDALVLDPFQVP